MECVLPLVVPFISPIAHEMLHRLRDTRFVGVDTLLLILLDELVQFSLGNVIELHPMLDDLMRQSLVCLKKVFDCIQFTGIFNRGFDNLPSH